MYRYIYRVLYIYSCTEYFVCVLCFFDGARGEVATLFEWGGRGGRGGSFWVLLHLEAAWGWEAVGGGVVELFLGGCWCTIVPACYRFILLYFCFGDTILVCSASSTVGILPHGASLL